MSVYEKLQIVQQKLKAPKNQFNSFGKYNYRSCEDILEGLKPILDEVKATVILNDNIELIGDRYYIRAVAHFIDSDDGRDLISTAYAREDLDKKGMDLAQVTGSVSSYARKYALNGLFCIDDTKDSDSTNEHDKKPSSNNTEQPKTLSDGQVSRLFAIASKKGYNPEAVKKTIMQKYNTSEVKSLSKVHYDEAVKGYEGLPDKVV
jgi:hypothetical protein